MDIPTFAFIFAVIAAVAVLFQLALAGGAPWGHLAMGGRYPGQFPANLRIAAIFQGALLAFFALVVLSRAGLYFPALQNTANWAIWVVVVFSGLSLVMNLITQSKWERIIWAPAGLIMLICSLVVAMG